MSCAGGRIRGHCLKNNFTGQPANGGEVFLSREFSKLLSAKGEHPVAKSPTWCQEGRDAASTFHGRFDFSGFHLHLIQQWCNSPVRKIPAFNPLQWSDFDGEFQLRWQSLLEVMLA
jgi:hypothetical protein